MILKRTRARSRKTSPLAVVVAAIQLAFRSSGQLALCTSIIAATFCAPALAQGTDALPEALTPIPTRLPRIKSSPDAAWPSGTSSTPGVDSSISGATNAASGATNSGAANTPTGAAQPSSNDQDGLRPPILAAPEDELADTPSQLGLRKRNVPPEPVVNDKESCPLLTTEELLKTRGAATQTAPIITGSASKGSLAGQVANISVEASSKFLTTSPLSRYRGSRLVFMQVTIKNESDVPILVLGNQTKAGDQRLTIPFSELEKQDNTLYGPAQKALVTAAGIGSFGLAGPLVSELMAPSEYRRKNLGLAMSRDRGRHEVEGERLGTRLLMPGDETIGWVSFPDGAETANAKKLLVPMMVPPYSAMAGALEIPITGSTTQFDSKVHGNATPMTDHTKRQL
jgi:hypothetical protein